MRALVIEPGHGSVWLEDAQYVDNGLVIEGWTWDDSSRGSALMSDDYMGERITLAYPISLIRKVVDEAAA
jgi:hypothetical protein